MKLLIVCIIGTIVYGLWMRKLVKEWKILETAEKRKEYQTAPLMFASTLCYAVFIIQTINLSVKGVFPLL